MPAAREEFRRFRLRVSSSSAMVWDSAFVIAVVISGDVGTGPATGYGITYNGRSFRPTQN